MVSEKKKQILQEGNKQMKDYPVVGIINMHKMPGKQLHEIRNKLRDEAVIRMVKKRLIIKLLEQSDARNIRELSGYVKGEPALLFSKTNPFKLARKIDSSRSPAPAKPGDIAPQDIVIKAGPTKLPPGPAIGDLQKVKLPAGVQGDKISILKDTTIVKKGEEINANVAGVLAKLGIEPMEISLNVNAAWEEGVVYPAEILFRPLSEYECEVRQAASDAFSLSLNISYFTAETTPMLIAKAYAEANALAAGADIMTPDTLGAIFAKASAQAGVIAGMIKEPEPAKEETSKETRPEKEEKSE